MAARDGNFHEIAQGKIEKEGKRIVNQDSRKEKKTMNVRSFFSRVLVFVPFALHKVSLEEKIK